MASDIAQRSLDVLNRRFGEAPRLPSMVTRAPGRINILGEHTDYNQGFVLPAATVQATYVACQARGDQLCRVWTDAFDETDEFDVADPLPPSEGRSWRHYVRGVAWSLRSAGVGLRGMDAVILGDLRIGAGVASSASVEIAFALALLAAAGEEMDPRDLALVCQRAENEFVGMRCGILDHYASLLSHEGAALLIDCRSRESTAIPLATAPVAFVVCDTAKPRALVESEYNVRRSQCEAAARALGVPSLRDVTAELLEAKRDLLTDETYRRAWHVVTENRRVLEGVKALQSGDFAGLGALMSEAHESLRDDYEVSCPELEAMVEAAQATRGCLGARLMGAGFGGSVLALVWGSEAVEFCRSVEAAYRSRTGLDGQAFVTRPSQGAGLLSPPPKIVS